MQRSDKELFAIRQKTLEFSFNEESLIRNGWINAAIDGSFLEEDEVSRIMSLSKKSTIFLLESRQIV